MCLVKRGVFGGEIRYKNLLTGIYHQSLGIKVLLSPQWTEEISWASQTMKLEDIAFAKLEGAPKFNPKEGVNREFEGDLYDYYGRPKYW